MTQKIFLYANKYTSDGRLLTEVEIDAEKTLPRLVTWQGRFFIKSSTLLGDFTYHEVECVHIP